MSLFIQRDVLGLIFQSIPTDNHKYFALINKSCYSVYSKFIDTIRKNIPNDYIRTHLPFIVYYCVMCKVLTKRSSETRISRCNDCHKRLCMTCDKKAFKCDDCGIDRKWRNTYTFCSECLKKCPSCEKLKHCFSKSCEVCEQEVCKDCIFRRWRACKKCQKQVCECGKPITEILKCYGCGKKAKHKETVCSKETCLSRDPDTFRTYCCACVTLEFWTGCRECPQCEEYSEHILERTDDILEKIRQNNDEVLQRINEVL